MKKGWTITVTGLFMLAAVVLAPMAWAAEDGPKVSVDFKGATIQEAADFLSVKSGVNIVVERSVVGQVNLKVNDVNWLEVLILAARQVGCGVKEGESGIYHVATPHFSFTTKAEGVSLKQVISLLAQQSGQNVVVAPDVDAVVHFTLQDVPWQVALDTVVKTAGPFVVVRDDAGVHRVVRTDALSEQKETQVFKLKYIQPPSEYKPNLKNEFAEKRESSSTGQRELKDNFTLYKALDVIVEDNGSVQYDFDSNAFIVTTTKPLLDEVAEIIRLVDVPVDQVFVDVKFITTGYTDLLNQGVRFPKGFMISGNGGSMVHRLPFNLYKGGWEDSLSVTGDSPTQDDIDNALGGAGAYTFGILDFTNISPVLELLATDSNSEIVQAPQLMVIDNKSATIFAGEEIHFAEEFSTTNQGGQLSRGIREADKNSPVSVGTQLLIMPHIVPGTDKIVLSVIPTSQQLTGTSSPAVDGFERFSVGDSFIDLPRLSSRTVVTQMLLQDGQTAVIGGLINQGHTDNKTRVPYLSDIPILGWLFKNVQVSKNVNNLYIFITVRIVRNETDMDNLFAEYDVPGAHLKPYRPGMTYPEEPAVEAEPAPEEEPQPAEPVAIEEEPHVLDTGADVLGKGWEETEEGIEEFEVKE